jgi:hypothetical protein
VSGVHPDVLAAQKLDGLDLLTGDLDIAGVQEWYVHDAGQVIKVIVRMDDGRRFTLTAEEQP